MMRTFGLISSVAVPFGGGTLIPDLDPKGSTQVVGTQLIVQDANCRTSVNINIIGESNVDINEALESIKQHYSSACLHLDSRKITSLHGTFNWPGRSGSQADDTSNLICNRVRIDGADANRNWLGSYYTAGSAGVDSHPKLFRNKLQADGVLATMDKSKSIDPDNVADYLACGQLSVLNDAITEDVMGYLRTHRGEFSENRVLFTDEIESIQQEARQSYDTVMEDIPEPPLAKPTVVSADNGHLNIHELSTGECTTTVQVPQFRAQTATPASISRAFEEPEPPSVESVSMGPMGAAEREALLNDFKTRMDIAVAAKIAEARERPVVTFQVPPAVSERLPDWGFETTGCLALETLNPGECPTNIRASVFSSSGEVRVKCTRQTWGPHFEWFASYVTIRTKLDAFKWPTEATPSMESIACATCVKLRGIQGEAARIKLVKSIVTK